MKRVRKREVYTYAHQQYNTINRMVFDMTWYLEVNFVELIIRKVPFKLTQTTCRWVLWHGIYNICGCYIYYYTKTWIVNFRQLSSEMDSLFYWTFLCYCVSLSKDILKFIMTRITYCTTLLVVSEHGSHNNKCHKKMHFSQKSKTSFTRSKLYFVRGRVQYILCLRHIFFIARIIFKFITKRIPVNNLSKNLIWPIHRKSNGSLPLVSSLLLL